MRALQIPEGTESAGGSSDPRLIDPVLGEDGHSIDLRQVSPFASLLTQDERKTAIERARHGAR